MRLLWYNLLSKFQQDLDNFRLESPLRKSRRNGQRNTRVPVTRACLNRRRPKVRYKYYGYKDTPCRYPVDGFMVEYKKSILVSSVWTSLSRKKGISGNLEGESQTKTLHIAAFLRALNILRYQLAQFDSSKPFIPRVLNREGFWAKLSIPNDSCKCPPHYAS